MKKLFLFLILSLPVALMAKDEKPKYLAGAVPQDANGLVVFSQELALDSKNQSDIYNTLKAWSDSLAQTAIHDGRTRLMESDSSTGTIVYRVEEWMTFKKRFLHFDRTRFRYNLNIKCNNGFVKVSINNISYYYDEKMDDNMKPTGEGGQTYVAEKWITDSEAIKKSGKTLYPYSGKFRCKTIDRIEILFAEIRDRLVTKSGLSVIK